MTSATNHPLSSSRPYIPTIHWRHCHQSIPDTLNSSKTRLPRLLQFPIPWIIWWTITSTILAVFDFFTHGSSLSTQLRSPSPNSPQSSRPKYWGHFGHRSVRRWGNGSCIFIWSCPRKFLSNDSRLAAGTTARTAFAHQTHFSTTILNSEIIRIDYERAMSVPRLFVGLLQNSPHCRYLSNHPYFQHHLRSIGCASLLEFGIPCHRVFAIFGLMSRFSSVKRHSWARYQTTQRTVNP